MAHEPTHWDENNPLLIGWAAPKRKAVMPEYTTTEAAALLETARRNVQNYCRRHGLKKFGREYVVTQADIEAMRLELGKVGRKAKQDK